MTHDIEPPEWFILTEVADNYTHTFGAAKKSRNYVMYPSTLQRFFMLREGLLIYYVDEGSPKGCMDITNCTVTLRNKGKKDENVLIEADPASKEPPLELSQIVITPEFLNWKPTRSEKDQPNADRLSTMAAEEVVAAIRSHAAIARFKKDYGTYFALLLANQATAVVPGSAMWHHLYKHIHELDRDLSASTELQALRQHSSWNGGGAHPLVQKLWQSFAQLLYLQVEKDCVPGNTYIPEMVDNYNKFVQSCLARSHVACVRAAEYDNNDPTMAIVRLNQVLAIQGKFDEYVSNTKMLIDFSLNKGGANLLASTQCVLLAITLRDELGDRAQGKLWAVKALEIFESSSNKDHHPLVYPGSEQERRENLKAALKSFD